VPATGRWEELLNSDAAAYGGSNLGNDGGRETEGQPEDGLEQSLVIELPPLALVIFRLANLPLQ
jgi:1,4-alpha-glucan branching enzyme